jgi:hypothetical protein
MPPAKNLPIIVTFLPGTIDPQRRLHRPFHYGDEFIRASLLPHRTK